MQRAWIKRRRKPRQGEMGGHCSAFFVTKPRALLRFDPRRFHFELAIVKIEDAFGLNSLSQIVSFQVSPSPETFSAGTACHQLVVFNVIGDLEINRPAGFAVESVVQRLSHEQTVNLLRRKCESDGSWYSLHPVHSAETGLDSERHGEVPQRKPHPRQAGALRHRTRRPLSSDVCPDGLSRSVSAFDGAAFLRRATRSSGAVTPLSKRITAKCPALKYAGDFGSTQLGAMAV